MNRFLKNIFYFTAFLTCINVALWLAARKLYFKDYHKYSLAFRSYLLADSHGTPLGQLTGKYGIYNFSAQSESYEDMYRKIRFLIRQKAIDTIYLTADDHTLSPYRQTANNRDASAYYLSRSDYGHYYDYLKNRYLIPYVMFFQPKALSAIRIFITSKIKKLISGKGNQADPDSSTPWADAAGKYRTEKAEERAKEQFPPGKASSKLSKTLMDIIRVCKENQIVLIGIKFPLASAYIKASEGKTFGAEDILKAQGIPVMDYKLVFRDRDDFFENQDHLNKEGARHFIEAWLAVKPE